MSNAKFNYGQTVKTAKRLIQKFGSEVVVTTTSNTPNPDPWKPGTGNKPETVTSGVFLRYEEKNIDGTVIQKGDQKVLIVAENFPYSPSLSGMIKRKLKDGTYERWNIVKISPLNPGGTIILYTIQVRQ